MIPPSAMRVLIPLLLICGMPAINAQSIVPDQVISGIISGLRGNNYNTGALLIPYLGALMNPPLTLLIPTDAAIANLQPIQESELIPIARLHMLRNNFSFAELQLLPNGTFLPTLLPNARVEVTNNTANTYTINNAAIVNKDICPQAIANFVTCQGISEVLSLEPEPNPAPAPSPSSAEAVTTLAPSIGAAPLGLFPLTASVPASANFNGASSLHATRTSGLMAAFFTFFVAAFSFL